jgi:FAD/FMN-containing dehydrogenase
MMRATAMIGLEARNWEGSVVSHPAIIVYPQSVDDLIEIMKNPERYPAPVRAVGSNHSTTRCGIADGGTLVVMTRMNRLVETVAVLRECRTRQPVHRQRGLRRH